MRDKKFYIDAIKMDLYRVVTATGDIRKKIPYDSVKEFLNHAISDFSKIELTEHEIKLKDELTNKMKQINSITDPHKRLRWAEDILTIRCRL